MPRDSDTQVPERKAVKAALRAAGLSHRQVDSLLRDGWKSLVGEVQAEAQELKDKLAELMRNLT